MALGVGGKGFVSEINVTPFVDVMLVLLIIFMVTAPLMTQGIEVDLPQTRTVASLPEDSDHVILTVSGNGTLFLDEYRLELDELEKHLATVMSGTNKLLYLKADRAVPYGVVVKVMARAKAAGVEKLGVVAEEETDP
ncbi:MAG: ExbD/TolR family protein [Deltaproteobacteria bacterium]|nr:ExbD/TolR family protein [Deltaproteobacteria bacterium]